MGMNFILWLNKFLNFFSLLLYYPIFILFKLPDEFYCILLFEWILLNNFHSILTLASTHLYVKLAVRSLLLCIIIVTCLLGWKPNNLRFNSELLINGNIVWLKIVHNFSLVSVVHCIAYNLKFFLQEKKSILELLFQYCWFSFLEKLIGIVFNIWLFWHVMKVFRYNRL